jgi:hypothetical protein
MPDYTGDFSIQSLILTNTTGETVDLRFVMLEINVYESLWNNNTTCDILINDANNLIMNIPMFGYETLLLEFQTPQSELWSNTFRLMRITDRVLTKERSLGYILHFVSEESITNLKTRVSKSYKGMLISDIANDLQTNWLSSSFDGNAGLETTKYQHHIIIPNISPVHALNWLTTHANSTGYTGSNYLYYQDKYGYNFCTMESRMAQSPTQNYLFQVANVRNNQSLLPDFTSNDVAALKYTLDHQSDIMTNMRTGMYGNQLLTHSHSRKIWRSYTFDYPSSFDNYTHLYADNMLESSATPDTNSPNSHLKLHPTGHDQDGYPFLPEAWLPIRISQLQQLHNIRFTITVPGDSMRTVGEVVSFQLPSPEQPIQNKQVMDKYYSGNFLVNGVRHIIDIDKYRTVLEITKDSTLTQYP